MKSPRQPSVHQVFASACDALPPLAPGAALLLGCSAGGDSMALLDLAARQRRKRRWRLAAAHLDHAQRPESRDEARFLRRRCALLGLDFISERLKWPPDAPAPASEARLRQARYAFFRRAARKARARILVLAHQADDRAETLLMRLLAGSGPTGLASIRPIETLDGLTVVRPLLSLRRDQLRRYLQSRRLPWRDDPANDDLRYKRAWVRNRVLPLFAERMGRDVTPRILRACQLAQEESSALDQACDLLLDALLQPADPPALQRFQLASPFWRRARTGLRRRLLRGWLARLAGRPHPPSYLAVANALDFAERAADGAVLRTVGRVHWLKSAGGLLAFPPGVAPLPPARPRRRAAPR